MKKGLHLLLLLLLAFHAVSQVDVGPTALVNPTSPQCGASNQSVIVTITNFSPATINFAVNNVTVNVAISGASIQTFNSPVLTSGSLASGASMNVLVTSSADLSAIGTHSFNLTTVNFSDVNPANNALGPIDILVNAPPTPADAGPDAGACTTSTLSGNTPVVGTGTWTLISGSGTITSPNSPTTTVTGLGGGPNTFEWTITNPPCAPSSDQVVITGPAPPTTADAGPDQTFCAPNGSLSGNTPIVGTGAWTLISGTGTITDPASPSSTITGLGIGPNTFRWTISNSPCLDSFDDVVISGDPAPTISLSSAAGTDAQAICVNTAITPITYAVGGSAAGASATGLPAGVTGSFSSGTFTISGTPNTAGIFNYTVTTTGGTCTPVSVNGTITVNPDASITLSSAAGTDVQTVCVNTAITDITYAIAGGGTGASATGLPAGVTGSFAGGTFTITGTPTITGTFNYTVTTTGNCAQNSASGTITVNPDATIALSSAAGTDAQSLCMNTPLTAITYAIGGGGTGASATGLPAGVSGSFSGGTFTISGTPTTPGFYNYTVTTTGSCVQANTAGTITVNPDATITLTSVPATENQALCVNTAISTITYTITGGGTGAIITGLPAGVSGLYSAGVVTISGTPTVAGTYNYTVTTTGTCAQAVDAGVITVNPDATITLSSTPGTDAQTVCVNTALTTITYAIGGGGTGASATGLPAGVTGSFAGGTFTISGTSSATGIFNYTVTTTGTCSQTSANGTITINPDGTLTLTSAPSTISQTVCINNAITDITYATGGGATGAFATGLPSGVSGSFAAGTFTILGTPTVSGTFNFMVTTTGSCASTNATGTITVNPDATITLSSAAGTDNQTVCTATAISPITYAIGGGGTDAFAIGLPAGVSGSFSGGTFTISGTPTASGVYNYTVTTTGSCAQTSINGTITASPGATITLTSGPGTNAQTVCLNAPITDITYNIGGSGTGATVSGLPSGVSGSYSAGTFTISGTPSMAGTFTYTVTTTGGTCPPISAIGTITSAVQTITLITDPFTNDQFICETEPIDTIVYAIGGSGGGATVTDIPAGVTAVYNAGTLTLSGTPTETGMFYYTVTTTGSCATAFAIGSIAINPSIVNNTSGTNTTVCEGNTVTLTGGIVGGGDGAYDYIWETSTSANGPYSPAPGINTSSNYISGALTTATPSVYFRRTVTSAGCSDTAAPVLVTVDSLPSASGSGIATICTNGTAVVSGISASSSSFSWSHDGSGTLAYTTTLMPAYTPSPADEGNTVTLLLTVLSTNSCASETDTAVFTVVIQPSPVAFASGTTTVCPDGGTATVFGASASNGTIQWIHDGGGTLSNATTLFPVYSAVPADAGDTVTLTLLVSDTVGCGETDSAFYYVIVKQVGSAYVNAGEDVTISLGGSAQLDATGPAIVNWSWNPADALSNPNIPDPVANPLETTVFTLTATDVNGCLAIDSLTVTVEEDFNLIIANLITPDNDGKNDTWIIQHIENYPNTSVMIVNRQGQMVYENSDYDNSWGGTYEGKLLPDGTYYYILQFETSDKVYKGAVNIIQN